jgi:tRNA-modifying protein YgfZ
LISKYLQLPSAALRIKGPDANTFLQGQFSQDVRLFLGGEIYGLWLNQKGRALADSHVCRVSDEEHWIFSFRVAGDVIRQRLEAYLIADEVQVEDESARWAALAVWGGDAERALKGLGYEVPALGRFAMNEGAFVFRARFAGPASMAVVCRVEAVKDLARRLSDAGAVPGKFEELERDRIAAGIPAVPDDIGEHELPNEGGLDADAVSFTKGCFLGQEVMARLKNLGQVRRRLFRIRGEGPPPPARSGIFQSEKKIGDTRTAAPTSEGFVAFAMLSLVNYNAADGAVLDDGRRVVIEELKHG